MPVVGAVVYGSPGADEFQARPYGVLGATLGRIEGDREQLYAWLG